jgi:spermidine synthase
MASRARRERRTDQHVTLSEEDGVRYLHFGTEWIQGGMRIARPFALELAYQQQMMAPLLFLPRPGRIVQLGLGAAALTKFCWKQLENTEIVAVDISAAVIDTARRWFRLPPDDDRLTVIEADAYQFIADPRRRRWTDWLQVDLYDAAAAGPVYDDVPFYRACRAALRGRGVAAFNLFGRGFDVSFAAIAQAFDDRVLVLPESDGGNRIALGFVGPPLELEFGPLFATARQLEAQFRLPLRRWADGLREANGLNGTVRL